MTAKLTERTLRALGLLAALWTASCSDDTNLLPPGKCNTNDDCPADQHCEAGDCVAGTGNECEGNDDCGAGMICNVVTNCGATRCSGNTCIAKPCSGHDECVLDGLVCRDGTCQAPEACDDTGMCLEDGLYCNGDNLCVPPGTLCTDDDACGPDLICIMMQCEIPTECMDSSECPTDLRCVGGVCNEPCTADADCGPPLLWYCDTAMMECLNRCLNDGMCTDPLICDDMAAPGPGGACVPPECTMDAECDVGANEVCEMGRCVVREPCGPGGMCPIGSTCNMTTNRCEPLPACRTDRDCMGSAYCDNGFCVPAEDCTSTPCPTDFDCIGDVCVPSVCRGPADCTTAGDLCIGGVCQPPPSPDAVIDVVIITPAGVVRPTTTYRFVALALDQAGRAVPGLTFEWLSSMVTVASIDATGLATGGAVPGVTEIRARVQTANGPITSDPVELTNLGPLANGIRITVLRATNGTPISGADVSITTAGGSDDATTNAQGVASFPTLDVGNGYEVTVAHANFDYVSVVGATSDDAVIPLPPLTRPDVAAGVQGTVDLSQVTTEGGLSLSLSGVSIASPLFGFDAANFFGGDVINVDVPMLGTIGIPAGNTVEVEVMGFNLPLKTEYFARAQPGLRSVWSFGGRVGIDNGMFGNLNNLVAVILPFFQRFEHAVVPTLTTVGIPTIVDTNDFDGDMDTTEMIPDWNSFPAQPMQPRIAQSLRYELSVDNLPFVSGGNANTLVIIAGTILPGIGFVPLGLDGQSDDMGSGIVPTFTTKMAPPHTGLEAGDYAVLAGAVRIDGGLPGPGSARLFVASEIPIAVDMSDGWLDSPLDATWLDETREVGLPNLPGADLYHIVFAAPEGTWHVYAPPPAGAMLAIPAAPTGNLDRTASSTVTVDAVDLNGADPGTLFEVTAGGAVGIDRVTRGFSRAVIGR